MIDIEKMKKKLQNMDSSKSKSDRLEMYKPTEGQQDVIRFLPSADGDPFKEYYFHWGVTKGGIMCPKEMYGEECPICGFVSTLWASYNESKDEETKSAAMKLRAKPRYYSLVLDRSREADGALVYSYSKTVAQALITMVCDPDYGDITDKRAGHDIKISYGKKNGQSYPSTDLTPRPSKVPLLQDADAADELIANLPNLDVLHSPMAYDEMVEALDKYMSGMDTDAFSDDDDGEEKYGGDAPAKNVNDMLADLKKQLDEDDE